MTSAKIAYNWIIIVGKRQNVCPIKVQDYNKLNSNWLLQKTAKILQQDISLYLKGQLDIKAHFYSSSISQDSLKRGHGF